MSETKNLFRAQAIMYKTVRQQGAPLIYQPLLLKIATYALSLLFLGVIVTISLTHYKSTVAVRGNLSPLDGTIKVFANSAGRLERILVQEGQAVTAGMALAVISSARYSRQGLEKSRPALAQMRTEQVFLQDQLALTRQLQAHNESQQKKSISDLHHSIALVNGEFGLLNKQIELSEENMSAQAMVLDQRGISHTQYNQYQANHLSLLQQRQNMQLRIHSLTGELEQTQTQRSSSSLQYQQEQLRIQSQIDRLEHQYQQLELEKSETLIATTDGIVTAITTELGQYSDPSQPLLYIDTTSDRVEAILYVPSRAIGSIQLQQSVLINYDAYSSQSYGSYLATIHSISQTPIDPRQHLLPIVSLQEPVYLVKARLEQQHVSGRHENPVLPGMLFTAEVVTDDLTILQHIFSPLTRLQRKT